MPIDEATYEQLERWLRGELNAEEQTAFELKLAEDPELLAEAEWFGNAQEALRDEGRAAMKKLIAGVGAGVSVASLAAYTPSRNVIPKWKAWLKKFWWIPVGLLAAGSLVAFLTTANEIVEGELPPLIPDSWMDTAKKDSSPRIDSCEKESLHINHSIDENQKNSNLDANSFPKDTAGALGNFVYNYVENDLSFGHPFKSPDEPIINAALEQRLSESQIFVEEKYNGIVKRLMIDSGYNNREQLLAALKRRKIEVFDTPPVKPPAEK